MKAIRLFQYIILAIILSVSGCKEKTDPPGKPANLTLTVVSQTEIDLSWSDNSTNESGFKIERAQGGGTVWSQVTSTIQDVKSYKNTGLTPGTSYSYKVLAFNSAGNSDYSNIASASTMAAQTLPVVTTASVSSVTQNSASGGGNVSSDGNATVTARGVCWSTSANPSVSDQKTTDGSGMGTFTSSITGLTSSTTYYARAYATNAIGTGYGAEISFTTTANLPAVTTATPSAVTSTSASTGGNVTSDGGASVISRGICYSTSVNPTTSDSKTADGAGLGIFTSSLTGLTPCTTYHIRAYATNSAGTAYGNDLQFTTGTIVVSVTTTAISGISSAGATSGGTITGDCAASVTARGVCYSTTVNPTTANSKTSDGTGGGTFSSTITGLTANTTYHVRAYATNPAGTVYGADVQFTTSPGPPVVSTSSVTMLSSAAVNLGGNVSSDGGASVTARGVCYSTSSNPTIANSKTSDGTGTGTFASSLTGLTPNTLYYTRAYATNSAGTGYGSNVSFTTPAQVADIDGNSYNVVVINSYYWMQQNLKVTKYNDGSGLVPYTDTAYVPVSYYHMYNNNATYGNTYGYMYNGYVVGSGLNVCPTGWHIPTINEWSAISTYLGGNTVSGGKMKETGTTYWNSPNTGADNSSGFSARGGGYYFNTYANLKNSSIWWTSTSKRYVQMDYNSAGTSGIGSSLTSSSDDNAFYIRCKKDPIF